MEIVHHLLPGPALVVHAGVEHEPDGAEQLVRQTPEIGVRVFVEADLLAQPFGIERPAFDVGAVVGRAGGKGAGRAASAQWRSADDAREGPRGRRSTSIPRQRPLLIVARY